MPAAAATTATTAASTSPGVPRRLVLVPVGDRSEPVVRRYRLARLRLEEHAAQGRKDRFAHLARAYD